MDLDSQQGVRREWSGLLDRQTTPLRAKDARPLFDPEALQEPFKTQIVQMLIGVGIRWLVIQVRPPPFPRPPVFATSVAKTMEVMKATTGRPVWWGQTF